MKPLILLHGALGAASDFEQLLPLLSPHYELFLFDLPGHGQNKERPSKFSIPLFADALNDFINTNHLEQPLIFGYSMGGYVACLLQFQKPVFSHIYTLGTKFIWNESQAQKEAQNLDPKSLAEKFPAYTNALAAKHGADYWDENMRLTAQMMLALGKEAALSTTDYSSIQSKIAIGLGDKDKMVPIEDAIQVYRQLPHACLDVLPMTQHPLDRVKPELLAQRLHYFFHL
ncbi:MAG: alpha/beta hydrolase [Sphingobacteriaceae bacterium]|nr:alpha/beta hydrolase [Sphingobacteriaceae bacterium]